MLLYLPLTINVKTTFYEAIIKTAVIHFNYNRNYHVLSIAKVSIGSSNICNRQSTVTIDHSGSIRSANSKNTNHIVISRKTLLRADEMTTNLQLVAKAKWLLIISV